MFEIGTASARSHGLWYQGFVPGPIITPAYQNLKQIFQDVLAIYLCGLLDLQVIAFSDSAKPITPVWQPQRLRYPQLRTNAASRQPQCQ